VNSTSAWWARHRRTRSWSSDRSWPIGWCSSSDQPIPRLTRGELAKQTLLCRKAGSSTQRATDHHLERHRLRIADRWELDSPEAIKQAVRAGLGVAFISDLVVAEEIADRRLVEVEVPGVPGPERTLDLVRSAQHALTPAETAFVALLDERLGIVAA